MRSTRLPTGRPITSLHCACEPPRLNRVRLLQGQLGRAVKAIDSKSIAPACRPKETHVALGRGVQRRSRSTSWVCNTGRLDSLRPGPPRAVGCVSKPGRRQTSRRCRFSYKWPGVARVSITQAVDRRRGPETWPRQSRVAYLLLTDWRYRQPHLAIDPISQELTHLQCTTSQFLFGAQY